MKKLYTFGLLMIFCSSVIHGMYIPARTTGRRVQTTVTPAQAAVYRQRLGGYQVQRPVAARTYRTSPTTMTYNEPRGQNKSWFSWLWGNGEEASQKTDEPSQQRKSNNNGPRSGAHYSQSHQTYTQLGITLSTMFALDHYARKHLNAVKIEIERLRFVNPGEPLVNVGVFLNNKDKQLLLDAVRTYIEQKLGYSVVMTPTGTKMGNRNFKDIPIGELRDFADKCEFLIGLGVDLKPAINIRNLEKFQKALLEIDNYDCAQLSLQYESYQTEPVNDSRINQNTTIDSIHKMIKNDNVPFLDEDIKKIMGYLSNKSLKMETFNGRRGIRIDDTNISGPRIVFTGYNVLLHLNKVEIAAKRGELRISLLNFFDLLPSWKSANIKPVEYRKGSDELKNKIYDLLQESNRIEKERILEAYDTLCNTPSFMTAIATGSSYKQRSYESSGGKGSSREAEKQESDSEKRLQVFRDLLSKKTTTKAAAAAEWRKYIRLVHPDLASDLIEKKRRTEETQELNRLYQAYLERFE